MEPAATPSSAPTVDVNVVDELVARLGDRQESLVPLLQAMQDHWHYLPEPALRRLCEVSRISPADVAGVSRFYPQFRHAPAGRHVVRVCHGTACHVQGAEQIEAALRRELRLRPRQDTDDAGEFTLERVGCLGCCTLAPVIQVDRQTHGHAKPQAVAEVLAAARAARHVHEHGDEAPEMDLAVDPGLPQVRVGVGSCCVAGGSMEVQRAIRRALAAMGARDGQGGGLRRHVPPDAARRGPAPRSSAGALRAGVRRPRRGHRPGSLPSRRPAATAR